MGPRQAAEPPLSLQQAAAALAVEGEWLPLSLSQREVWLDLKAWPDSAHLNIGGGAILRGPLDVTRLERALQLLVSRHQALRLVPAEDGRQRLLPVFQARLERADLAPGSETAQQAEMRERWQAEMRRPWPRDGRPPWRFSLLRAHEQLHGLSIQFQHLIMDGWGTTQLMHSWSELYRSPAAADPGSVPGSDAGPASPAEQGGDYLDFIRESRAYRQSEAFARDAAFWAGQIAALPLTPEPLLPPRLVAAAAAAAPGRLPEAHVHAHALARGDYEALERAAGAQGLSVFNCLLGALALYLGRVSERSELLIGVPHLNRQGPRFRRTPGMFVGILALRIQLPPEGTAGQLLHHVGTQMLAALRHARYPLSELVHAGSGPLEVLLSFERQDYQLSFGAAQLQDSRQLFSGLARFPLALTLCEFGARSAPSLVLEASSARFEAAETALLARRIWRLTQELVRHPERPLAQIELLPDEERWALLDGLHKDLAQLDRATPCTELFAHQARLRPQACALVWDQGQMSYGELARRSATLARRLRALGAGPGCIVALAMERSPAMVVALLAIARSGAAFLPLDPQQPQARLAGMLLDSAALALLIDADLGPRLAGLHGRTLSLPDALEHDGLDDEAQLPAVQADSLAYVLFTSGSSGRPKGVLVEHGSLSRRLAWLARAWAIDARDRAIQGTQLCFDPALIELLMPLSQGASIALPPPGRLHPRRLAEQITTHQASFGAFVPSTLAGLLRAWTQASPGAMGAERVPLPARLRVICCGGETLAPQLAQHFSQISRARVYNLYGPTEATIFATAWDCSGPRPPAKLPARTNTGPAGAELEPDVPLGSPVGDSRLYVLDGQRRPLPFGVVGEIYLGGSGLARGYLGRPDLDAQAFWPDPFVCPGEQETPSPPPRMYRSGDRGWLDCCGRLHFAGRRDRQVKLRGYRIELGEIEAACLALPGVTQAAARLLPGPRGPRLHAWLAGPELLGTGGSPSSAASSGVSPAGLRASLQAGLRARLPDAMRPSGLSLLAALPLTPNGKIDHAALPEPEPEPEPGCTPLPLAQTARQGQAHPGAVPIGPRHALEQQLMVLWREALRPPGAGGAPGPSFGIFDDFFALGGDSLSALAVLAAMEDRLGRRLPLQLMHEHPSIAALAQALGAPAPRPGLLQRLHADVRRRAGDPAGPAPALWADPQDESCGPAAPALYLAASGHGDVLRLQALAAALGSAVRLYMLQPAPDGDACSMQELAAQYADCVEAQNDGPVWLAGFSVGGVTALATAVALHERGRSPRGLILLDSIHPGALFGASASWRTLGWLVRKLHVQDLSMNGRRLGAMFSDPGLISQVQALRGHRCRPFPGPVLLLQSAGLARWQGLLFKAWHTLMPAQLQTRQISGMHGSIFEPGPIAELAAALLEFMRTAASETDAGREPR